MSKQAWRYKAFEDNTRLIEEFCAKHNLAIEYLNNGYQLRINGVIDLYPVRQKWHYLKTNQRGVYENIEDLDLTIFYNYRNGRGEYKMPPPAVRKLEGEKPDIHTVRVGDKVVIANGVDPLKYLDLTTDKVHKYKPVKLRKWWQFWRKR